MSRICRLLGVVCAVAVGPSMADTYRFAGAEDSDWMNGRNWQNQTAGTNGWQVPDGIALPGADDTVRFNYGNAAGTLAADAGTVDAFQLGVDEGGSLTLNPGASLTTDSGGWSGMGAGGPCSASLTINGGLLTINNSWRMGVNDNAYSATLEIHGGEMRVASGFSQTKATTTAYTAIYGGVLDVDSLTLSAGLIDVAGGTLILRGDYRSDVIAWVSAGRMVADGGAAGARLDATFAGGMTTVVSVSDVRVTVPHVTGLPLATAEADIVSAGLMVGRVTLALGGPGDSPGTVLSQTPEGGVDASAGSAVDLVVVAPDVPDPDTADLIPESDITEGSYTTENYYGRVVWVPDNPANMLYFDVPGSFDFVPGLPVYARIEYHDSGRGWFFAEYDSSLGNTTADKYRDAEIHARSSRVGQGGFVYTYQLFEAPLFNGRQNGRNDFRFSLQGAGGTPLRIASVQLSNRPYEDETFQFALSRPWLQPYAGPVNDFTSPHTLSGKVMTGYQGWFATPNDPDDQGWRHWGRSSSIDPSATEITIDMWPWINEYRTDKIYPAGEMVHQDGRLAYLFSSRDRETVQRHFRWMRKHDIDGAYLQRFVSRSSSGYYGAPEFVLNNVREAANREGRVWAIEYDVSSLTGEANPLEVITNDWRWLVDEAGILDDPRYVHEDGKPVLFIWGFSVPGREGLTLAEADAIIDWFAGENLYLIAGVHSSWEGNTDWFGHYRKYDQLLAWMERSKSDLIRQRQLLDSWGMKILPHAWPGFSWHNLNRLVPDDQYTARAGGRFYWTRLYNAVSCGADQVFLGMFDEYDEGTAIMPMSGNHPDPHTAWGKYIDNEGRDPFWYLALSGAGRQMLNGLRPLSGTLPQESSVLPGAFTGDDGTVHLGTTDTASGLAHTQPADGLTRGTFIDGHPCRTSEGGGYFYFDIDDSLCLGNVDGQAATIQIEFYDDDPDTRFRLQYDGLDGAYTQHPETIDPADAGGWRSVRWNISDGFFGNRQNDSSDFRIAIGVGNDAAIRRVSFFLPEERSGVEMADVPRLEVNTRNVEWPVESDAVGWRLSETDTLSGDGWQDVPGPFNYSNGLMQHEMTATNGPVFYRLERPARQ